MVEKYLCPHVQAVDDHAACVYAGTNPFITLVDKKVYSCIGSGPLGGIVKDCAYLHELNLLETIADNTEARR